MIKRILLRMRGQPVFLMAVILVSTMFSIILCFLHQQGQEELRSFEETYHSVPVYIKVTDLDGSDIDRTEPIQGLLADLFLEDSKFSPSFADLIRDLQMRMSHRAFQGEDASLETGITEDLIGITSLQVARELTVEYGGSIQWEPGYDESVFASDALVCVVPADFDGEGELQLTFTYKNIEEKIDKQYTCSLQIVGRYTGSGNRKLYCPYAVMEQIYRRVSEPKKVEHISAILKDNGDLALLRETADQWFARPNPMGEPTPWGKFGFAYYFNALDINDSLLQNLEINLKNSLRMNRLAAAVVFVLSTGSGFLTGFLVIRARKREILLMRTLGTSNALVCLEFELEQLLCVVVGVILGGSSARWAPIGQLSIFAGTYLAGLTVALLIFIRSNLLATMKEDA